MAFSIAEAGDSRSINCPPECCDLDYSIPGFAPPPIKKTALVAVFFIELGR